MAVTCREYPEVALQVVALQWRSWCQRDLLLHMSIRVFCPVAQLLRSCRFERLVVPQPENICDADFMLINKVGTEKYISSLPKEVSRRPLRLVSTRAFNSSRNSRGCPDQRRGDTLRSFTRVLLHLPQPLSTSYDTFPAHYHYCPLQSWSIEQYAFSV